MTRANMDAQSGAEGSVRSCMIISKKIHVSAGGILRKALGRRAEMVFLHGTCLALSMKRKTRMHVAPDRHERGYGRKMHRDVYPHLDNYFPGW